MNYNFAIIQLYDKYLQKLLVQFVNQTKTTFEQVKIKKEEELDISQVSDKLIAPHVKFIEPIFKKDDPKEYFIPANEFAYNISNEKKYVKCLLLDRMDY